MRKTCASHVGLHGLLLIAVFSLAMLTLSSDAEESTVRIHITDRVVAADTRRIGINLGSIGPSSVSSRLLENIVLNPGFETGEMGSVVLAHRASTRTHFVMDFWNAGWNNDQYDVGQPVDFWTGGDWEIVYGQNAGKSGTIRRFDFVEVEGKQRYRFDLGVELDTRPKQWDVMFVRKRFTGPELAEYSTVALDGKPRVGSWRLSKDARPRTDDRPAHSDGEQVVELGPSYNGRVTQFYDSYYRDGDRSARKSFLADGHWRLRIKAKALGASGILRAQFSREGGEPAAEKQKIHFVDRPIPIGDEWQEYTVDFDVPPGTDLARTYTLKEYHPILDLTIGNDGKQTAVLIDDIWLGRRSPTSGTAFSASVVERLRELQPGVLRAWSDQHGASLETMLAPEFGRRGIGYGIGDRTPSTWIYSLPEFLDLCVVVGADPWWILPPTLRLDELDGLMDYLVGDQTTKYGAFRIARGHADPWTKVFDHIYLEYGNEAWGSASGGDPFKGATFLGGERLGTVAGHRFARLRQHPKFDAAKFRLIIGGQAGEPLRQRELQQNSAHHDAIALAPYFFNNEWQDWSSAEASYGKLYSTIIEDVAHGRVPASKRWLTERGTELYVYEQNFHTTHQGGVPVDERNRVVTSQGGGIALALAELLDMRDLGVKVNCAFALLQVSYRYEGKHPHESSYVRLWGMLRDLEHLRLKRPTFLAVEAINYAIGGEMLVTEQSGGDTWTQGPSAGIPKTLRIPYVYSFAFRDGDRRSIVLFNLDRQAARKVEVMTKGGRQGRSWQLAADDIYANNEDREEVRIVERAIGDVGDPLELELPAHSLTVIEWHGR